jgi:hypothetical protein
MGILPLTLSVLALLSSTTWIPAQRNAAGEDTTHDSKSALAAVRGYLGAMKALDAAGMHRYLADDYATIPSDGSPERLYNRAMAFPICAWEKIMLTRWRYQIISVHRNTVSVVLIEKNDYFALLGLGKRTQVSVYTVERGKVRRGASKLVVEESGTQDEALGRFRAWLRTQMNRPGSCISDAGMAIETHRG